MISFKFNDRTITLPTEWNEVLVKHFVNPYFLSGSTVKLLASLAEIPAKELANSSADLMEKFKKTTKFMQDDPMGWHSDTPQLFEFKGKTMTVPLDIEMKMFGQKIMLAEAIKRSDHVYAAIPDAVATYFGPEIYPDDWFERIEELKTEIMLLPIRNVFAIASFFLPNSHLLAKSGKES